MKENVLALVHYDCETENGYPFSLTVELIPWGGFKYGNGHGLVITEDSGDSYGLDARYDSRFTTVDGFYENVLDVLKERYAIAKCKLMVKE